MKWYQMGKDGNYTFWFRNPYEMEVGIVYQVTTDGKKPGCDAGYYNLENLMKLKNVHNIIPQQSKR